MKNEADLRAEVKRLKAENTKLSRLVNIEKNSDKTRIRWMLKVGAISGDWYEYDDWPDTWDSEVVRTVVDVAMLAERVRV